MTTIATVDMKKIHESFGQIKVHYPEDSERFQCVCHMCNCPQSDTIPWY